MLWLIPIVPIMAGLLVWGGGRATVSARGRPLSRGALGGVAALTIVAVLAVTGLTAFPLPEAGVPGPHPPAIPTDAFEWGAGVRLQLEMTPVVAVMALLVGTIALPVLLWAIAHGERGQRGEDSDGRALHRQIGLMLSFVGAMQLLVLAADLLTLVIGWELVGALSWSLIGHDLSSDEDGTDADYAFNATRTGGMGLFVAAGATMAAAGSWSFEAVAQTAATPFWGSVLAAGVLLAAASKSAQVPFSPWLFRAMSGPTSVSALLHSSTMVAAGAWLLIRLHEPLAKVGWFDEAAIAIGMTTALAGGLVASLQDRAKRLLAASTSAHYGFMFAAVGAGAASAGLAHLGTHAAFKSLLFLVAGTAIGLLGTHELHKMRLGRLLPITAATSTVAALALAGIPPLGAAWTKEKVIASLGHIHPGLAVAAIAAAVLSAWYAGRFHFLAYGRDTPERDGRKERRAEHWPGGSESTGMVFLAVLTLALSVLWLPGVYKPVGEALGLHWPHGELWEKILSPVLAALTLGGAWLVFGRGFSASGKASGEAPERSTGYETARNWLALPALIDSLFTGPTRRLADLCARFDDRVVDAGIRGTAWLAERVSEFGDRGLEGLLDDLVEGLAEFARWTARVGGRADDLVVDGAVRGLAALGIWTAHASKSTDDTLVDGAVEGTGQAVGKTAGPVRGTQTGQLPRYYVYVTVGLFALAVFTLIWR